MNFKVSEDQRLQRNLSRGKMSFAPIATEPNSKQMPMPKYFHIWVPTNGIVSGHKGKA